MSVIYERINIILKNRKISLVDLGESIGTSANSLSRTLREQTLSVEKLESISKFLNVSPSIWWIESDEKFRAEEPKSTYTVSKKDEHENVVDSLLHQVSFLNNVVSEQLGIIKNLSKK